MRPAILGIAGPLLAQAEASLLREYQPAGIILFARNIEDPAQLVSLIASLRSVLPPCGLLMVDQEGGRVARLRPPHWLSHPPARALGALFERDPGAGIRAAWLTGALIGADCGAAGFDVATAPVLDVASPQGHDVIGDRAFASSPATVAALGSAMAAGLLCAGIQPVAKHAPGHGRAQADSHFSLPTLDRITEADLVPFRACAWLPWLMTAHIRYISSDMENPATLSSAIIRDVIRGPRGIAFQGVLVSDDLAMNALTGTPGARAAAAIKAGCDIALHCSGILEESGDVLASLADALPSTLARLQRARDLASEKRRPLDVTALAAERDALLA
jgi:beta-N-acetylhexosaminidase